MKKGNVNAPGHTSVVGKPIPVKDAAEKVCGILRFGVDFELPRMLHGKILRSPHAHAKVLGIDAGKAEKIPGVFAVLTHLDTPRHDWFGCWHNYRGKVLDGIVRYVGDDVAAVAAETAEIAGQALEQIEVTYEVLPAALDMYTAGGDDAPKLREEGNARPTFKVDWGDVERESAATDHIVDCDVHFASQQYAPLGRNAAVAEWVGDKVTLWSSSQTPSELKDGIHQAFDIPQSKIRVVALPSGSSFGQWWSNNFHMITVALARKAGRPVKIELDNEECMGTVKRRHEEHATGRMGCNDDGELTFLEMDHLIDNGAYGYKDNVGFGVTEMWHPIRSARIRINGVNTNRVTGGCFRGVGDCTFSVAIEGMADQLAEKIDMDPIEFRLRNQIHPGDEFNKKSAMALMGGRSVEQYRADLSDDQRNEWPQSFHLSSGSTHQLLRRGAEQFRWRERWKGWATPNRVDGPRRRAIGVGTGAHCCGVEAEGATSAVVRINRDGSAKVFCSVGRQGQGSETTQAQVAAEALGFSIDRVEVEGGDTDACPWSHGSVASNTMYRTGWATREASLDARRQLLEIAAQECFGRIDPVELDIRDGLIGLKGGDNTDNTVTTADVLNLICSDTLAPTYSITGRPTRRMPPSTTYARQFAAHFVEVEVDIETGQTQIVDYLAAQDSGTVVNPQVLKNQIIGAAVCGMGFALYEQLLLDPETGATRNANLLDYKLLRTADFPWQSEQVIFEESCDGVGPYGARGAGESPIGAAISAVAQAMYNATGVRTDFPMTAERIVEALDGL